MTDKTTDGLKILRQPFPEHQISKLPKGTKEQNQCQASEKINCKVCGGWHHPRIRHLDYVGHAALTDRLLDADLMWYWEPLAYDEQGLPRFDASGGLWIKLSVNGMTRLGYGNAAKKEQMDVGSREKEVIGDALRNAGMRFGAALDLWHKGELHLPEQVPDEQNEKHVKPTAKLVTVTQAQKKQVFDDTIKYLSTGDEHGLMETWHGFGADEKVVLWGMFNSEQRRAIKTLLPPVPVSLASDTAPTEAAAPQY